MSATRSLPSPRVLQLAASRLQTPSVARPQTAGPVQSIFQQSWWLQAAAGDRLEQAEVRWDRTVVGSLWFVRQKKLGMTLLDMPPNTRTCGVTLQLPESKPARRLRNTHQVIAELLKVLPKHDRLQMTLGPGDETAFSLALSGCSLGQAFTFRTPAGRTLAEHWQQLDQKTRNMIRTAGKSLQVDRGRGIGDLLRLRAGSFGPPDREQVEALERLAQAAEIRNQGCSLVARNAEGRVVSAVFLVWDAECLYLWQSSRDREGARAGAGNLLVWESIVLASELGVTFDIDGYHTLEAAHFVSRFGLLPVARTNVLHMSQRWRRLQALGRLVGRGNGFGVQPLGWAGGSDDRG